MKSAAPDYEKRRRFDFKYKEKRLDVIGLGTLINTAAVVIGSALGMLFKQKLNSRFQEALMRVLGVNTLFVGIAGGMSGLLKITEEGLKGRGSLLMILSLVLGALLGEWLDIDAAVERLGEWLRSKAGADSKSPFVEGFATASIIICVGAMAVVGAFQDGLTGDYSLLLTKSMLDFVLVMMLSAAFGIGVMFSALPLFIYQGVLTLLATALAPLLTAAIIADLSYVGAILVFCVGLNLTFSKTLIRVANLLPALLFVVLLSPLLH